VINPKPALFAAGAALFHVLVTALLFAGLFCLYALTILPRVSAEKALAALPPLFAAAFALSCVVYRLVLKRLLRRGLSVAVGHGAVDIPLV
jgi:branched-subunit amino acid ABC-type transport system permease component